MSEITITQTRLKNLARRLAWAFLVVALIGYVCGWGGVLVLAGMVLITEYL